MKYSNFGAKIQICAKVKVCQYAILGRKSRILEKCGLQKGLPAGAAAVFLLTT